MRYSDIEIPSWCKDREPNHPLGCWSLIGGLVEDHSHCTSCEMFRPIVTNEKEVILNNAVLGWHLGSGSKIGAAYKFLFSKLPINKAMEDLANEVS